MSAGAKWALGLGVVIAIGCLINFFGERASPTVIDLYGVRPPIGSGLLLDASQVRYCVTEEMRLNTIFPLVDKQSDQAINRVNARIQDFNGRCASAKYGPGMSQRARKEMEAHRASIEGSARLQWAAEK